MSLEQTILRNDSNDEDKVLLAKGVSMLVLFVASMICGFAPMILARWFKWTSVEEASNLKTSNRVVVCLLFFGGGVLLFTNFLHLIPEVDESVVYLQGIGSLNDIGLSLTPLLTCSGFFMMYLIEETVHLYIHYRERRNKKEPFVRNLSCRKSRISSNGSSSTDSTADLMKKEKGSALDNEAIRDNHIAGHAHSHMPIASEESISATLHSLIIVLALSIHEIFEGLIVGLESTSAEVWYMLGAISAHKLVLSFCIGVELLATRTKLWLSVAYLTIFGIVTSLGIGIGILLVGGQGASGVYSVVLQGLASGTVLYVIFFEIWNQNRNGILQFFASLVGFCLMLGLKMLTGHSHSHSHGGSGADHGHSHNH